MKQFLKNTEVVLQNGGYLCNAKGEPVTNEDFIAAQRRAEYVVTFANLAKTKNFKSTKVDSLDNLRQEVLSILNNKTVSFVESPTPVKRKLTDELAKEALAFVNFQENSSKTKKVNAFLQEFAVLKEFSEFGLFFDQDVVKLNKIYTLEEVITAVTETIELL